MQQEEEASSAGLAAAAEKLAAAQQEYTAEAARQWRPPDDVIRKLARAVQGAFDSACAALTAQHTALRNMEQNNAYTLIHKCAPLTCRKILQFYARSRLIKSPEPKSGSSLSVCAHIFAEWGKERGEQDAQI